MRPGLIAAAILAVTLNLRPAIIAVSPQLDAIRAGAGLSGTAAGLLTTLPVLCFGLLAPLAPRLARRIGSEPTIAAVLVVLAAGIALRDVPGVVPLLAGTVVVGGAIAVANVLMPSVIKRELPDHVGTMTGLYTVAVVGGATLAAGVTVPLRDALGLGWRGGLGLWLVPALVALVAWVPFALTRRTAAVAPAPPGRLRTSALAWWVTAFMGLQSLVFYSSVAWIPTILVDAGASEAHAGLMLSLMNLCGVPMALAIPALAGRAERQSSFAVLVAGLYAAGLAGLALAPSGATVVWMVLLGLAQGASLGLALMLIVLRAPDAEHTARLSGMAQGVGYVIAASGPLAAGALHTLSGGWDLPLVALIVLLVPTAVAGVVAGRPGHVATSRGSPARP